MTATSLTALQHFLQHSEHPASAALRNRLAAISPDNERDVISLYQDAIPLIEEALWADTPDDTRLKRYQQIFRELEAHFDAENNDQRHHIILFIPVADRPRQLNDCLDSLLQLCRIYHYGGIKNGRYQKVTVMIADDSKEANNMRQHKAICNAFNNHGLETIYFGQEQQLQQLAQLSDEDRQGLAGIIGKTEATHFYHKGSPRMRNIASLKLNELQQRYKNVLFYSLDSDQEFQIKIGTPEGDRNLYAINYFYYLDQIFSRTDACILTGKVVGDPPVSPAVMAVNFLQDVIDFVTQMSRLGQQQDCHFHFSDLLKTDDAAYHDMPELFGFKHTKQIFHYPCPLKHEHDNAACFKRFAEKLNGFFYGEHPTRKTFYAYSHAFDSLAPARTVYPGNYVFNAEGLKYFIPFAPLKLRMNGPVMGRIVKAGLKQRFVSANLPMLHKRTVADTGESEFRPDIFQQSQQIDISGEFERQYFGDVMLFSMQSLTEQAFPSTSLRRNAVAEIVNTTEKNIRRQYLSKHQQLSDKLAELKTLLHTSEHWWNQHSDFTPAMAAFNTFIDNIEYNFGDDSRAYQLINSEPGKQARMTQIVEAILRYPEDRHQWQQALLLNPVAGGII